MLVLSSEYLPTALIRLICLVVSIPDSTFQYVQGKDSCIHSSGVYKQGLQSVTVLIGAYHRNTGLPVLGVINQPFHNHDPQQGRYAERQYVIMPSSTLMYFDLKPQ